MKALWNELVENESGMILSAELILVLTIAVLGVVTGLSCVQQAVVSELQDLAMAFRGLNQSYATPSYRGCWKWWGGRTSWSAGSGFINIYDGCVGVTTGSTNMGYAATGQTGVAHGTSEISAGVGCNTVATPLNNSSPTVLVPQPIPASTAHPCEGCQPGSETATPTPMNH